MNIYHTLNQAIEYIEENLENEIEYKKIAQILGMNENTAQSVFFVLCDISLSEYIRKRRLSNAGSDLYNTDSTIMDIAIKYQYNNATSFSRAFEKFHGIKPSQVKKKPDGLKVYSKIVFDENVEERKSIEYSIIEMNEKILYGICKKTNNEKIGKDAPELWKTKEKKYLKKYGYFDYGMTVYENGLRERCCEYWVLYDKKIDEKEFKKVVIPKSKWIMFRINSQETSDIQDVADRFYKEFFISAKYKFSSIPELEYYHDDVVDFLVPIEE